MNVGYALIMASAIAAGAFLSRRTQASLILTRSEKLGIGLGAFCGAMIGAKLPFVLADWRGFLDGSAWFSDGKTILCGLVGGYFGVEVAKWSLGVCAKTGDSFAVPVATAVGIGRLACFQAGCCYGTPTSLAWGVVFPAVDLQPRHPTQLYETVFHLSLACLLWLLFKRGVLRGQLVKLYILLYAAYRFVTEFIRPEANLWGGLTGYQYATFALAILFAWLWWRDRPAPAPPQRP